jgi:uncharacterized membrane protein
MFLFFGFLPFILIVVAIFVIVMIFNLRSRVNALEKLVANHKAGISVKDETPAPVVQSINTPQPQVVQNQVVNTGPTVSNRFVNWLKDDWLLKIGAGLLIIGFGWLTTYAFLNNWIGPMGRIALGIIAGSFFIALGWWRIQKYIHQGGVFMVIGSTVILLTIFAGREIYDFFTPLTALMVMFISTLFIGIASAKYKSNALALAGLILASVAPLLTNSPTNDYVGLFSYLLVVILGLVWVVTMTGNRALTFAGLIIFALYSSPYILSFASSDKGTLLLFAYLFAIIFFITNTFGILKSKVITFDVLNAGLNGLLLLFWIASAGSTEWKSLIITAWTLVFLVAAFAIYKITQRKEPFFVYSGIGIIMLATATAIELNGHYLTIAYTFEIAVIMLLSYIFTKNVKLTAKLSWLFVGPITLSLGSIDTYAWKNSIIHADFFVLFILAIVLLGIGSFIYLKDKTSNDFVSKSLITTLITIGSIYVYILIWLSLHAGLTNDNTATMISLTIYTLIGLFIYFKGLSRQSRLFKIYGGILVGFVVLHLLIVDIWSMSMSGKIITFFLIGALLIATAFIGKKQKIQINN